MARIPVTTARATRILGGLAALGVVGGLAAAFLVAPRETTQGNVQRIMYLHVPAVWVSWNGPRYAT